MTRYLPALPLIGGGTTKLQPVYVGDVASAVLKALNGEAQQGTIYELGGPEISTFRAILEFILTETERHRPLVGIPFPVAKLMGSATETMKSLLFGLLPNLLDLTSDQVELLKKDNVVSEEAQAKKLTCEGLGLIPQSYEVIVPTYLYRYRKTGQFARHPLG
jgi:NADH dehydrogenase